MNKAKLQEQRAALEAKQEARLAQINSGAPGLDFNKIGEEMDADDAAIQELEKQIEAIEKLEARAKQNVKRSEITNPKDLRENAPFESFGQFLFAVKDHALGTTDPRLVKLAPSGQNETVDSEGGFLVGTDQSPEIFRKVWDQSIVAPLTRQVTISRNSNGITYPALDEDSRKDGSRNGGARAYWLAEGATKIPSMLAFKALTLRLKKLAAVCIATDELLEDAVAMESFIMDVFPDEMAFQLDNAILFGDGVGKPYGIFSSPAVVTVAAEGSQTADTITANNILAMWARMPAANRRTAVWLVSPTAEGQLPTLRIGDNLVWMPPGGLTGNTNSTLLGRPVYSVEQMNPIGDVGDIALIDPKAYILARKGGIKTDRSIHVKFLTDETAFRFVMRVDGGPLWTAAVDPFKGTDKVSPYIQLAAR